MSSEKYLQFIKGVVKRFACKYGLDREDLLQDFFLYLLHGNNTSVEHVGFNRLKYERRRGVTGHRELNDFKFNPVEALREVRETHRKLDSIEFREFMIDMLTPMSPVERKFFLLAIKGYTKPEIVVEIRKEFPISNADFWEMAKETDYSSWGNAYKQDGKVYY